MAGPDSADELRAEPLQTYVVSAAQLALQPSPSVVLPSSQASPLFMSTAESPQWLVAPGTLWQ